MKSTVEGAYATDSLLWVKVTRVMADQMAHDRLSTEQLVKTWMRGWKQITGRKAVTVTIEWRKVEIAKGQTTITGTDRVTVR